MKSSIKLIIFALVFGSITGSAQTVVARETKQYTPLVASSGVEFSNFMNKKAKKFISQNDTDWRIFTAVVDLYNNSTVGFYSLDESVRNDFFASSERITAKLNGMRKSEAKEWAKTVKLTSSVFKFIWDNKANALPVNEEIIVPALNPVAQQSI
ncbi:hypothetical protein GVN16_10965 [Emticicia sp. CRIBPO]|uniref:hypothetical protein n=1 Tax=Emticicia sp. CRIBPO TaxID=2683258 RepID=UPI001412D89B|nr:hypothetical protein [Emticicia sp. CRIBPO]NBA86286.1 hypothetical protein [Emticicia sp. CRIBPO]